MDKIKNLWNGIKNAVSTKWKGFADWREATKERFEEWSEDHPTLSTVAMAVYYAVIYTAVYWAVFSLFVWATVKIALWKTSKEVAE